MWAFCWHYRWELWNITGTNASTLVTTWLQHTENSTVHMHFVFLSNGNNPSHQPHPAIITTQLLSLTIWPSRCSAAPTRPTHRHALRPPSPEVQRLAVTEFLQRSPALALPSHSLQRRFRRLSSRHLNPHKGPLGNSARLMSRTCHLTVGRWP